MNAQKMLEKNQSERKIYIHLGDVSGNMRECGL